MFDYFNLHGTASWLRIKFYSWARKKKEYKQKKQKMPRQTETSSRTSNLKDVSTQQQQQLVPFPVYGSFFKCLKTLAW